MRAQRLFLVLLVLVGSNALAEQASSIAPVSVSQLGSCSSENLGELKVVNDSDGATSGTCTASGGGSALGQCQCDGSNWIVRGNAPDLSSYVSLASAPQAVTCVDTEDPAAGALTIAPTAGVVAITNADEHGCAITMSESGAVAGSKVSLVVVSSAGGTVDFADSAGVSEIAGAFTAAVQDSISLVYVGSAWVEVGRSNN